ncbi:hypothetical protein [Salibacter halophilus]|uniref:Uncharacterized protein n=1 Tax=Salibacter halophilus TaxID=1803916 RepID=A0A6N6MCJ9_9FLAO|nr:hypothetical protein [Salibacter halophilus]KAB1065118.1 hypothetical protein F3059_03975 [Salibacter halophilus]
MENNSIPRTFQQVHVFTLHGFQPFMKKLLEELLNSHELISGWSLDIDDWENVLCVKSNTLSSIEIQNMLKAQDLPIAIMNH